MTFNVLVVDDSVMVRLQVKNALGAAFSVVEACDGVEALEVLESVGDVSLVVCDVNMPKMSGLDFLARVRAQSKWDSLAVVMLTTEVQAELVQRARGLGAKGWLIKPFKPELLMVIAKKLAGDRAA
jgi:two-component system chemotaxis response regulator CheY